MQDGSDILDRTVEQESPAHLELPCRVWTGYLNPENGYALYTMNGVRDYAHRQSHRYFIGPIPDGFHIDHLCRVHACVEPTHLEAVTRKINAERGIKATATHCVNDHEFTPANTTIRANGTRTCKRCNADRARRAYRSRQLQAA